MKKKIASQANPVRYFFALRGQEPPLLFGRFKSQRYTEHWHGDRRQVVDKIPREIRAGSKWLLISESCRHQKIANENKAVTGHFLVAENFVEANFSVSSCAF